MKYKWLIILILLAGAGTAAWFFLVKKKEAVVTVVTEKPHYGDVALSINSTGTLEPVDTVVVGSQVSGIIQAVYVDFNSKVKKGELVAQIDRTVLQAQLDQIKASLVQAQSQLAYENSTYLRENQLYNVGAISKADYENALNNFNSAKAQIDNLKSQIVAADKNLSYTEIYSPIDGTVLSRNVSVGQTVAASFNTPTLFVIAKDLTKMQVQAAVDEADIGNVDTSESATFTVDAFPTDIFKGRVQQIRLEPVVSSNVVTYSTIVNAPNDDMKLKPGMTASITIITKQEKNVMIIPAKALAFTPDSATLKNYVIIGKRTGDGKGKGKKKQSNLQDSAQKKNVLKTHPKISDSSEVDVNYIWIQRGDTIRMKRIHTGLNDDTNVEVIDGLSPDDDVVTGVEQQTTENSTSSATRSPFMPTRPGNTKSTNSSSAAKKPS